MDFVGLLYFPIIMFFLLMTALAILRQESRKWSRAGPGSGTERPFPPMTLGNMRSLGIRTVEAICDETLCGHSAGLHVAALPDDTPVPDIALRLRCSRCGSKAVSTRPLWTEYSARGRATYATREVGANS